MQNKKYFLTVITLIFDNCLVQKHRHDHHHYSEWKDFFTSSLLTLPELNFEDVSRIVGKHSATNSSKQNK